VVDDDHVGAFAGGGLEQLEVGGDAGDDALDLVGARHLNPVGAVIVELADREQLVAERDNLAEGGQGPSLDANTIPAMNQPAQPSFIESLMDTDLYSMGAFFSDQHPDLVEEVVARAEAIERAGLETWAEENEIPVEEAYRTLLTGLAVRYYKAVAG
jgi:hypothetical protein